MKPSKVAHALHAYVESIISGRVNIHDVFPLGVQGPPGCAKSALLKQLRDAFGLYFTPKQELRPGDRDVIDMRGVPSQGATRDDPTQWHRPDFFPPEVLPEGYEWSLLLIEEIDKAVPSMKNLLLQLLLDRRLGEWILPDHCIVLFAGNDKASRSGSATGINWAFNSRAIWLDMEPDLEDTLAHYKVAGIHPFIRSWLKMNPSALTDFDPKSTAMTFCCSRTLAQCDNVLMMALDPDVRRDMLCGTIGPRGVSLNAFIEKSKELPEDIEDCWVRPDDTMVVESPDAKWMLMDALASEEHLNVSTVKGICKYVSRYSGEWQARWLDELKRRGDADKVFAYKDVKSIAAQHGHLMITS